MIVSAGGDPRNVTRPVMVAASATMDDDLVLVLTRPANTGKTFVTVFAVTSVWFNWISIGAGVVFVRELPELCVGLTDVAERVDGIAFENFSPLSVEPIA